MICSSGGDCSTLAPLTYFGEKAGSLSGWNGNCMRCLQVGVSNNMLAAKQKGN